jgi:DNA-binding PadR family transcriptional regulator
MPPKQRRQTRHLPAFVLLALAQAPRHGGALHAALQERLPGLKVDTAAVYRTLQALEAEGELAAAWDTSIPGPARKVYSLTPLGRQRLAAWRDDIKMRLDLLTQFLDAYDRLPAS